MRTPVAALLALASAAAAHPGHVFFPGQPLAPGADGGVFDYQNVVLRSRISLPEFAALTSVTFTSGSDCWGYTSPSGREYAVMGLNAGFAFIEITDPSDPVYVGFIPKPSSLWGDVAIYNNYCYLVSDASGEGIRIIDLANIDNGVLRNVGAVTPGGVRTVHSAYVFENHLYLSGSNAPTSGLIALSLANPESPTVAGTYANNGYCHDFQIVRYTSGPYAGREIGFLSMGGLGIDVVDVTNKAAMFRMSRTTYPGLAYAHQTWLEPSTNLIYANDELDDDDVGAIPALTRVFDVTNLSAPARVGQFTTGLNVVDHNNYIEGGLLFQANYRSGLQIFDIEANPLNPPRVGFFDTFPGPDAVQFNGAWNVFPYFPSGNVIVSDIEGGLFVLDPTFARIGGAPLAISFPDGLPDLVSPAGRSFRVNIQPVNNGALDPASPPQVLYRTSPTAPFAAVTMTPLSGNDWQATLPATPCLSELEFFVRARATHPGLTGGVDVAEPLIAPLDFFRATVASARTIDLEDTLEVNSGWTVGAPGDNATAGLWVRADPVGTAAQPEDDTTPAPGVNCYVTGNAAPGAPIGDNDVDGGTTSLTSPVFSALPPAGGEAYIVYNRWYSNDRGPAANQDSMPVLISNNGGSTWVQLELVTENAGTWVRKEFRVADVLTPTATMRLRFQARDLGSGSIVEAGVDDLQVVFLRCNPPGDANGDGQVNFLDLNIVLGTFGQSGALPGDVNGDGVVNFLDLNIVLGNFGAGA